MNDNNIIDIEAEVVSVGDNVDDIIKELTEMNSKVVDKDGGAWVYIEGHGICWKPCGGDRMGQPLGVPSPSTPPPTIESLIEWGNKIDLDNIPQNAVVLIKLNTDDMFRFNMLQRAIAKQVLEPRIEKLKEKRVCILFLESGDDISVMTEEEMNQAGWEKRDKGRIITL